MLGIGADATVDFVGTADPNVGNVQWDCSGGDLVLRHVVVSLMFVLHEYRDHNLLTPTWCTMGIDERPI